MLNAEMTVQEATEQVQRNKMHCWPVESTLGIVGVVNLDMLQKALADGAATKKLSDLIDPLNFPHLHSDHSLTSALERLGTSHLEMLPVVSRADVHKLEGIVVLQDVLKFYGLGQ